MNDFNAEMAGAGDNLLQDNDGVIDDQPFGDAADPYALNDNDNMIEDDPEKAAFINQEEARYDLNFLTQMDGMAENSAEIEKFVQESQDCNFLQEDGSE